MLYQKEIMSTLDSSGCDWWVKALIMLALFGLCFLITYLKERSIKRCLLWACSEAERILGSGTGKLKLRQVYDVFVSKYPIISTFVPFNLFCSWIDNALVELRAMIENNENIRRFIEKGEE